ncbi:MAG: DNA repair protein RadC [Patescibacteria group bacterium]
MQSYAIKSNVLFLDRPFRKYILTVRDLPTEGKPRERLMKQGPEALSLRELLSVVLNTGTTKEGVLEMADRIIRDYGEKSILAEKDANKLSREMNIPIVKACQIVAVGELGRRVYERNQSGFSTIRNAKDAYDYLQDMRNLPKEHLRGLYLNSHNRVIRDEVISIGTINSNMIHPREVFRPAIESNAAAVVLAHNHPSGEATPSEEDIEITKQLVQAGKILGISLLDHVVITKDSFASIQANY